MKIYIKETIPYKEITRNNYNNGNLEYLYIQLAAPEDLNIFSCYYPKRGLTPQEWEF